MLGAKKEVSAKRGEKKNPFSHIIHIRVKIEGKGHLRLFANASLHLLNVLYPRTEKIDRKGFCMARG